MSRTDNCTPRGPSRYAMVAGNVNVVGKRIQPPSHQPIGVRGRERVRERGRGGRRKGKDGRKVRIMYIWISGDRKEEGALWPLENGRSAPRSSR